MGSGIIIACETHESAGATVKQLHAEAFDAFEECPDCKSALVHGEQADIRLDNDHSMNVSLSADPENAGVKITADLKVKICPSCNWSAVFVETTAYAGY